MQRAAKAYPIPVQTGGVYETSVGSEIVFQYYPEDRPDALVAEVASDARSPQEPFSVKLVGHKTFVFVCVCGPQVIVFSVPQAFLKRFESL